jgi:hypothetical protein
LPILWLAPRNVAGTVTIPKGVSNFGKPRTSGRFRSPQRRFLWRTKQEGGKHFDVEAIFDVYAFAETQRVAEDQNPATGARILRNEPLGVRSALRLQSSPAALIRVVRRFGALLRKRSINHIWSVVRFWPNVVGRENLGVCDGGTWRRNGGGVSIDGRYSHLPVPGPG